MNEQRISVLERRLDRSERLTRRLGLAGAVLGGALLLLGARGGTVVVQAERFELLDDDGKVSAVLAHDGDGPYLAFIDGKKERRVLGLDEAGVAVASVKAKPTPKKDEPKKKKVFYDGMDLDGTERATNHKVKIDFPNSTRFHSVELVCYETGFRARGKVDNGSVTIKNVPDGVTCTGYPKGGGPVKGKFRAGDRKVCRVENTVLNCVDQD